jgi:hypothetical protein
MPHDQDSQAGRVHDGSAAGVLGAVPKRMLQVLILPMLPLLSLQRNTLPIIRTSLQRDKDDYIRTIDKFVSLELHALLMVLDPARKLRSRFNENLEQDLAAEFTKVLEKLAAGLINMVEVQEMILSRLIDVLKESKNGKQAGNGAATFPRLTDILPDKKNGQDGNPIDMIVSRLADILNEARNSKNGNPIEEILSRLAKALSDAKDGATAGPASAGLSRIIEMLRGKAVLSRLKDILNEAKDGKQEKPEKA